MEASRDEISLSVLEGVMHHIRVAEAYAHAAMAAVDHLPLVREADGREPRVVGRIFALVEATLQSVSTGLDACEDALRRTSRPA